MNTNQHNQPVASALDSNVVAVRNDHVNSPQFEEWLGQSLEALVNKYSAFVTTNSNRRYFRNQSGSR